MSGAIEREVMIDTIRENMRNSDRLSLSIVEAGERMERNVARDLQPEQYVGAAYAMLATCEQVREMFTSQPHTPDQDYAIRVTMNVVSCAAVLLLDRAERS